MDVVNGYKQIWDIGIRLFKMSLCMFGSFMFCHICVISLSPLKKCNYLKVTYFSILNSIITHLFLYLSVG